MQVVVASLRAVFIVALSLILIDAAKAQQPVRIESDAGVISMVATVEAIDVTSQVLTVSGPNNNWVAVKVTPEDVRRIKVRDKITISYSDEVAVALRKLNEAPQSQMVSEEETGMNMNAPTEAEQDWVEATPQGTTQTLPPSRSLTRSQRSTATSELSPSPVTAARPALFKSVRPRRASMRLTSAI